MQNNATKPAAILQLEQELGIELKEVALDEINKSSHSFILNQQGKIVSLSLCGNEFNGLAAIKKFLN